MKLLKKAAALLFCVVLLCSFADVYAQPAFNASISLNSDIIKTGTTYLSLNEAFDVTVKLKTGKSYFAGPFAAQVFFTNAAIKYKSADFNKSGRLYSTAKSYSAITPSSSMTANNKSKIYPAGWTSTQRAKYDFCSITMVPNKTDASVSVDNLNETVATLHLCAGSATGTGTVFVSADSIKSASNTAGATYLSCLTDSGNIGSARYDYGTDAAIDLASASLSFTVTDLGDVDGNKNLNSSDSLVILQHITSVRKLTDSALTRGDLNKDGSVNSTDALGVLQLATSSIHLNSIIKR